MIRDHRRIEFYLRGLSMARRALAHLPVSRIFGVPAGISGNDILDTFQIVKHSLDTPETAGGQSSGF